MNKELEEYRRERDAIIEEIGDFDEEDFVKRQEHDQFKTNWCKENNIPLIRIDYIYLDTLTIKDLLLETTKHRVV